MSADNWATCPVCFLIAKGRYIRQKHAVARAYGAVSQEEYEAKQRALGQPPQESDRESTLREDYGQGIGDNGTFSVTYECSCERCGFSHRYRHSEQLDVDKIARAVAENTKGGNS